MKILILRVSAMGDVIHTLPAVFYLKQLFPQASISWVVQKKVASLLTEQAFLENLFILPDHFLRKENFRNTWTAIKKIRATKWDIIIDFQGLFKTGFVMFFLKGKKFGFNRQHTREQISTLFTHKRIVPSYINIIQKNLALVDGIANTINKEKKSCPTIQSIQKNFVIHTPQEKQSLVKTWLKTNIDQPYITLAPNTTWPSKHWPLAHWKKLLLLLEEQNISTTLLGASFGDYAKELKQYIQEKKLSTKITPQWDLITTSYFLKQTKLLIAPDTGILHLGDFLGIKTIGLFGPTLAKTHGPFLNQENIKNAIQIPCSHTYQKHHSGKSCMASLSPEELLKSISRVLKT